MPYFALLGKNCLSQENHLKRKPPHQTGEADNINVWQFSGLEIACHSRHFVDRLEGRRAHVVSILGLNHA